jgi:cyanophycinase
MSGSLFLAGGPAWLTGGGLGAIATPRGPIAVMPTAAAFDGADRVAQPVLDAAAAAGLNAEVVPVLSRHDAENTAFADSLARAGAIVLVGESPLHLRSVVKSTPVWDAVLDAWRDGASLAGVGWAGAALGDPMVDPRGGALTLGLGCVPFPFLPHADDWGADRTKRTLKMAKTLLVTVDSAAVAHWSPLDQWSGSGAGARAYRDGVAGELGSLPAPNR